MNYEKLFPGRFVKSADFDGKDVTLTISAVRAEDIDDKPKAILSFSNTKKSMVLNRTNAEALKLMFGKETDEWLGKRITFFPATIKDPFSDEMITAIRVRGSPDITKPANATIQRGRKTIKVAVAPTGQKNGNGHAKAKPVEPIQPEEPHLVPDDANAPWMTES